MHQCKIFGLGESEVSVEECLSGRLKDLHVKNVPSALVKAFIECYEQYTDEKISYIPLFSRYVAEALYRDFNCENIRDLLENANNYIQNLYKEFINSGAFEAVYMLDARLTSRLIINTSNPFLPLEVSLAWDPVLNLPYIPSSSIKGVSRSWIKLYIGSSIDGVSLDSIFGSEPGAPEKEKHASLVVFTDAYPVSCLSKLIEPDVITPHYRSVELKITEPEVTPTPIVFPTIAPGTIMRFIVAFKYGYSDKRVLTPEIVMKLVDYISRALEDGVGAKTSVGYGRVKISIKEKT
jgi:CRISPR-associated protein Cmr6